MEHTAVQARIHRIGRRLESLVARLKSHGFEFDRPNDVLPGPESNAPSAISRIEREIGEVPGALKQFWLRVGSVDLSGTHPEWHGCEYLDQLIVFPPSVAINELEEFMADREERLKANWPYAVIIAPDIYHKADVSGGLPYSITVPAESDDPAVHNATPIRTFLEHIEFALDYSGFPGLANCPDHSWPVEILRPPDD